METAAAAIANIIAYNVAAARVESALGASEIISVDHHAAGLLPKIVRNLDWIGVCALTASLMAYAATQVRM